MIQFERAGRPLTIALRRTRRRNSIALEVRPDGARILAPKRLAVRDIEAFVSSRSDWIEAKIRELEETGRAPGPRLWREGELFAWRGAELRLSIEPSERKRRLDVEAEGDALRVRGPADLVASSDAVARAVRRYFARRAEAHFRARLPELEQRVGAAARDLKVTHARRRWGSCDRKGVLRLAARLAMAPDRASDYVLVHELCHLHELNHSPAFWAHVARAMPDWREREKALAHASARCVL